MNCYKCKAYLKLDSETSDIIHERLAGIWVEERSLKTDKILVQCSCGAVSNVFGIKEVRIDEYISSEKASDEDIKKDTILRETIIMKLREETGQLCIAGIK